MATNLPPLPTTRHARVYGIIDDASVRDTGAKDVSLRDQGRSGLTPTFVFNKPIEQYQRRKLMGFTTFELLHSGCLEKENLGRFGLPLRGMHPMFAPERWWKDGDPLPDGLVGTWDARKGPVLTAIRPSLLIASRLLFESHVWLWWDALMYGPRKELNLPANEKDGGPDNLHAFFPRSAPLAAQSKGRQQARFRTLAALVDLRVDTLGPGILGRTDVKQGPSNVDKRITVSVSRDLLVPLLAPGDMTESEVLVQQSIIAKVLVHEVAHALMKLYFWENNQSGASENFFNEEEVAECGWSCEKAILGGHMSILRTGLRPKAVMSCFVTNFPNFFDHFKEGKWKQGRSYRYRSHGNFSASHDPPPTAWYWPVQISFFHQLRQEDFWKKEFTRIGQEALRPPRIIGLGVIKTGEGDRGADTIGSGQLIIGKDWEEWMGGSGELWRLGLPTTKEEIQRWEQDAWLRDRTASYWDALWKDSEAKAAGASGAQGAASGSWNQSTAMSGSMTWSQVAGRRP